MGRWEELDKKRAVQSGKGPGEFGPDYSYRKRYQLGHGNESPSPLLKEYLDNVREYEVGEEELPSTSRLTLALVLGLVGMGVIGLIYFL